METSLKNELWQKMRGWNFFAPLLFFFSIALLFIKSPQSHYLLLVPAIALPICSKWRTRGLWIVLPLLLLLYFLHIDQFHFREKFWQAGMALAFALASIIYALSLEEMDSLMQLGAHEEQRQETRIQLLEQSLSETKSADERAKEDFKKKIFQKEGEMLLLSQKVEEKERTLSCKIQELLCLNEELKSRLLEAENNKNYQEKRTPREPSQIEEQLLEVMREKKRMEGLYKQMREQFEEKSLLLEQVRKQLFYVEEEVTGLKMQQQEREESLEQQSIPLIGQALAEIGKLQEKEVHYLEEIQELQEIITVLSK